MRARLIGGACVALVSALLLLAAAGDYGLTWDEPVYVGIADGLGDWFSELVQPGAGGRAHLLSEERLRESYYSECIGGLRGAARLGFETSYWFDTYTPEALRQVQLRLPPHAALATYPNYGGYDLLRRWGLWRRDVEDAPLGRAQYLIVYMRKAALEAAPEVRRLLDESRPAWSLRSQGVVLIGLYRLRP